MGLPPGGQTNGLVLISLGDGKVWMFQYFPKQFEFEDKANWTQHETSAGVKPLQYASADPQRITIEEVWLDSSDAGGSVAEAVEELRALMKPGDAAGISHTPPLLRFILGSFQKTVVLESLRVNHTLFDRNGNPQRAQMSMTFIEFRRVERVTFRASEVDSLEPLTDVPSTDRRLHVFDR
jgi:phage protein U